MKVNTQFKFKYKYQQKLQNQEKPRVQIIFPTEVELSVDTVTKSLFSTCKTTKFKSFVKLRSRSRSGEGQVRVRRVRFGPELYNIFGFPNTYNLVLNGA